LKRPSRLKILSRQWEVEYATGSAMLDKDEIGCSDSEKQHITIKEGLKGDQERSTLLHETIHAVSDTLGLGLTEKQVQGLETGLFAMNRDNARLFSYLRGKK
jgi:hypothetical protein